MHIAPPESSLYPMFDIHAPMFPEHRSYPGVHGFDPVRRGGDGASFDELFIKICEKRPCMAEPLETASGFAQPLMLVSALAIDDGLFFQEALPRRAPVREGCEPLGRLVRVARMQKVLGDAVELDARLEIGAAGRASLHLAERMEDASLDACSRPMRALRLLDPAAPVANEDVGRSYAAHEASPVFRALRSGQVASYDVLISAGDEKHCLVPCDPKAVHVDDMVDLVAYRKDRP